MPVTVAVVLVALQFKGLLWAVYHKDGYDLQGPD